MAASPVGDDEVSSMPPQEKWSANDDSGRDLEPPPADAEHDANGSMPANGGGGGARDDNDDRDDYRTDAPGGSGTAKSAPGYRERQVKPNKVYIGGLPEHTRQEDLQNCFGKIGNIVNIELKLGYGFVEFDSKEAAEESVAKYHEGYFMGNKIRVEISRGGSRAQKTYGDPGACFKCGGTGHWARECTAAPLSTESPRKSTHHASHHSDHGDRSYSNRDYSSRDYPQYARDNDYGRYPSTKGESRYNYDYPPQSPPRDYRRPPSPSREYREYPAPSRRDYDDLRTRAPPPAPIPATRAYHHTDVPPTYTRGYDAPPPPAAALPREYVDRGDRRMSHNERYAPYPPIARPRTPPGPPPRARDDYDRPSARDFPPTDYRSRPITPPLPAPLSNSRYGDYPSRNGTEQRYRRRSQSPPPRASGYRASGYANDPVVESAEYPSGGPPYGASAGGYPGNGYSVGSSAPHRGNGRDYPSRGGHELGGYSRRG